MAQNLETVQEILDEMADDWFYACDAYELPQLRKPVSVGVSLRA